MRASVIDENLPAESPDRKSEADVLEIFIRINRQGTPPTKPGKTELSLEEAHRDLKTSPEEFDEVAAELGRTLDFFKVPESEKEEVLAAFAAHKNEVTAGYKAN